MSSKTIKFGFNHMVSPSLTPGALLTTAVKVGAAAVELRNDVGDNSVKDVDAARDIGAKAADLGLSIRSINALYPFNVWNDERARQAEALAKLARASRAEGLVVCPLNEGKLLEDTPEKAAGLRAALTALRDILGEYGIKGFVEPLGFPVSSLRFKREALAAIDAIGAADTFSLVHDTFHHAGAGEKEIFAKRTGLVHISGLEDPSIGFDDMLDGHRVLVGPKDRLGNIEQLRVLLDDGYDGIVSFEPFAKEVHDSPDPIGAIRRSMDYVRQQLGV